MSHEYIIVIGSYMQSQAFFRYFSSAMLTADAVALVVVVESVGLEASVTAGESGDAEDESGASA